jgi:hypothetical protein
VDKAQIPRLNLWGRGHPSSWLTDRNIEVMLLLGDSKVIIDWIIGKADLQAVALECWKERTLEATRLVKSLSALHIYREDNRIADILSK